ncbi:DUF3152 domain-containing protein [Streptomyces sp. ACA25]|uniref:DUF3152 domain-containing protein n=1 Tax=Streptomyces sp. ACA25 TaxID=3022596 RepID=UPI002307C628|nr:DUF3152 domain-containing protein [Streptomyces sp. ACA25]MDB1086859.1 DUF3152 domain-containing protein [Streptomyces sp. ACA25]
MERREHPAGTADPDRVTTPRTAGPRQGPRQDYVDAFDEQHYGAPPPSSSEPDPAVPGPRRHAGGSRRAAARREPGDRPGGWGRSLTGVTAAAVVTVLAVTVTGQVGDAEQEAATGPAERGDTSADPKSAGGGGVEAGRRDGQEPAYEEHLDSVSDLDPELAGSGELVPVPGSDPPADPDATTLLRYRVDVEPETDWDAGVFAEIVHRTLSDPRSWGNNGERSFARVSSGQYDFVVTLATPGTTAEWCAKSGLNVTVENVSCDSASTERVMINGWRWAQGAETYDGDIRGYRQMLINHEVGHRLGYGHVVCPGEGEPAPVMMQQTKFLTINGLTCEKNPWPHPDN